MTADKQESQRGRNPNGVWLCFVSFTFSELKGRAKDDVSELWSD